MFRGDYRFFDYKYNIAGYSGQDFGSFPQILYIVLSVIIIAGVLFAYKKCSNDTVKRTIRATGIFLIVFYICKTSWESFYDITQNGGFNYYLLPLDTCSIVMWASLMAGFCKGQIRDLAASWLATGCIVGGLANMLVLSAFKYYPFLSFGAFYSMIWHLLMVLSGLLLIVTDHVKMNFRTVLKGFVFHLAFSAVAIPVNYLFGFDFMLYKNLGGIPVFEGIASSLTARNMGWINPIMMLCLYFAAFNLVFLITVGIRRLKRGSAE